MSVPTVHPKATIANFWTAAVELNPASDRPRK